MFKPHGAHRARMLGVAALSVYTALLGTPATLAAPAQPAPPRAPPLRALWRGLGRVRWSPPP